jgi:hypothetical protein
MELASMLADEPFSDHPTSVCPVIGSLLRAYNDSIDDDRRQDLYAFASKVVGSRASDEVHRARAGRLVAWTREGTGGRLTRLRRRLEVSRSVPLDVHRLEAAGTQAVRSIRRHSDQTHAQVLALIDELLAIDPGRGATPTPGRGTAQAPAPAQARRAGANAATGCDQERATLLLLGARHKAT